jgi:hypothetical protein
MRSILALTLLAVAAPSNAVSFTAPPVSGAPVQEEPSGQAGPAQQVRARHYAYSAWSCADGRDNRTKPHMACYTDVQWKAKARAYCAQNTCAGRPCGVTGFHVGLDCVPAR